MSHFRTMRQFSSFSHFHALSRVVFLFLLLALKITQIDAYYWLLKNLDHSERVSDDSQRMQRQEKQR